MYVRVRVKVRVIVTRVMGQVHRNNFALSLVNSLTYPNTVWEKSHRNA